MQNRHRVVLLLEFLTPLFDVLGGLCLGRSGAAGQQSYRNHGAGDTFVKSHVDPSVSFGSDYSRSMCTPFSSSSRSSRLLAERWQTPLRAAKRRGILGPTA